MVVNVQKEHLCVIKLKRVNSQHIKQQHTIIGPLQISDQKQQSQVKFNLQQEEIFLKYTGETSSETSSIETAKLLINSTLLTKGKSLWLQTYIQNFYIQNDLEDNQYIHFAMDMISQDIIDEYNLKAIVHKDRYCYTEIRKAIYGLCEFGQTIT